MNTPRTSAGAAGLVAKLMETVRPEFRAEVFRPPRDSPVFFPGECRIPSCPTTLTMGQLKLCRTHHHRWAAAGRPVELDGWSAEEDARLHQRRQVSACLVAGCNRARAAHALCHRHASRWTHARRPPLGTWLGRTLYQPPRKPWSAERTCEFPDCPRWTDSTDAPLCHTHHNRWRKHGRPALDTWYDDLAHRGDPKIRLEQLAPALRLEFQFGLQHRHDEGLRFTPARDVRRAVTWAREAPTTSLLDWDESTWRDHVAPLGPGGKRHGHNVVAFRFIADTRFALEHLLIADDPWADQYPRDVWDLRHFALAEGETRFLRFGGIAQPWLRELVKRWCRWRISTNISVNTVAGNLRSLHHLSRHLSPNAAPADLTRTRIETWLAALAVDYPDVFTRRAAVSSLGRFLADARAHDWQPVLPRDAVIYNDAPPPPPAKPRWISEHLMRQMENPASLAMISTDDLRLMVPLLISCGLRMKDARRLRFDCVTHDDTGAPYLTWVNHKIHGRIAFFPISQALADEIAAQQKRVQARFPAGSRFLFPGWMANLNGSKAVSDTWCREQMETWLERIRLIDEHGRPARVTFHQFRHTLGTRLINANVPQHIVQQLLDHMSPQMTAIYARLHQKTLREHWEKSLKVNAEGEAVALPVDHPLADATWMRLSLVRAKVSLPNGYCGAPIQTDCEYANPCLDCRFFITTGDFLDQHRRQREETRKLIGDARASRPVAHRREEHPHARRARHHHRRPGTGRTTTDRGRRKGNRSRCHRLTTPASSSKPPRHAADKHASAPKKPSRQSPAATNGPPSSASQTQQVSPGPGYTRRPTSSPRSTSSSSEPRPPPQPPERGQRRLPAPQAGNRARTQSATPRPGLRPQPKTGDRPRRDPPPPRAVEHAGGWREQLTVKLWQNRRQPDAPEDLHRPPSTLPIVTQSPVELVIFDCDGVLVDSERICIKVDAMIMADLGCTFTEAEIIERFVGSSTEVYTAAVEERLGRRLEKGWQQQYEHLYDAAFEAELTAVDGIAEVLGRLTTAVCVASNGDHAGIRRSLEIADLTGHFEDHIFSATDVRRGKPAPDLFQHAARSMGVQPERCAVIEDSAYGVQAARAAGMRAFGYCGGLTPASRLEGAGTVVFDDMRNLPELLATAAI